MKRITAADRSVNQLIDEGWTIDRYSLYNGYRYSGTISPMQTRKGYEYCRVHHGRCKNVDIHGGPWHDGFSISCQFTTVLRRPVTC